MIGLGLGIGRGMKRGVEPRRNLLTYTEDFSNPAWVFQFATRNGLTTDPDGGTTAQLVTFNAQFGNVRQEISPVSAGDMTQSVYIRRISGNTALHLKMNSGGSLYLGPITITDSWARYSFTKAYDGSNPFINFMIQDRNASGFGQIAIWHPQIESASAATDYQAVLNT